MESYLKCKTKDVSVQCNLLASTTPSTSSPGPEVIALPELDISDFEIDTDASDNITLSQSDASL